MIDDRLIFYRLLLLHIGTTTAIVDGSLHGITKRGGGSGGHSPTPLGPEFIRLPPNVVQFSNSTGTVLPCVATGGGDAGGGGGEPLEIWWETVDGVRVQDSPGLLHVRSDGSLVFPPFRAMDYRADLHATSYHCMAKNGAGRIRSHDVHVKAGKRTATLSLLSVHTPCMIHA